MSGLDRMVQDLRDGIRRLTRYPRFTLLASGTLALGLSTSIAVFSYVNAYARPFPGARAGDLHRATRLVGGLLWGVAPADPLALVSGIGVLLVAVVLAVGVPLRRAMQTDPIAALRTE